MDVKDVRSLKEELENAVAEMVIKFEAETGCSVEYLDILHDPKQIWDIRISAQIEI